MRMRLGVLAFALVASLLAVGAPTNADDTTTTTGGTATTVEEPSTTAQDPTTTAGDTTTTSEAVPAPSVDTPTAVECPPETTVLGPTTTAADGATTTTIAGCTTTTVAETTSTTAGEAPASPTTSAPSELGSITPVGPVRVTPDRGTQLQVTPTPPPPTTTTTTTTTVPAPTYGLPGYSGSGRRVVYSKSRQRVWVVDSSGTVIKTHLVSGRQTPLDPRPGTYAVWSRSRYTHSINNPSITWGYMVRFAWGARGGNIGLHEIPWQYGYPVQTVAQLGLPLSGGCVRQAKPDAIWMWNWAQLGTKVVVLG